MADIEIPQPGASQIVGRVLSEALREHPDVQWLGLMSEDGFAIASEGSVTVDDDAVAAGAVRMMVQVRSMAKALGQSGTSQMFLEGDESGVCVIDKDPWVLVMVGAPGVPIGLLRYEAREIAEAFPMGQQPQPVEQATDVEAGEDLAAPAAPDVSEQSAPIEHEAAADAGEQAPDLLTDDQQWWSVPAAHAAADPEPEIRWADEPTRDQPAGEDETDVPATDWDWVAGVAPVEPVAPATPAEEPVSLDFTAAAGPMVFDMGPEPSAFDIPGFEAAPAPLVFDMPPVDESTPGYQGAAAAVPPGFGVPDYADAQFGGQSVPEVRRGAAPDLAQLAPPSGPAIELPAPRGPAFQLPPPA